MPINVIVENVFQNIYFLSLCHLMLYCHAINVLEILSFSQTPINVIVENVSQNTFVSCYLMLYCHVINVLQLEGT